MIEIDAQLLEDVKRHAADVAPRECCGVVVAFKGSQRYVPCRNASDTLGHFILDGEDYAAAEDLGEVLAIVHSHVNVPPTPSEADRIGCEASNLPWLIVNHPVGTHHIFEPSGFTAPLVGRQFCFGVADCYELARDYYRQEMGIALPAFDRVDDWWNKGQNLIEENFASTGFVEIPLSDLRPGDGLLMTVGGKVINHVAVYLGGNKILHHLNGRLSSKDIYSQMWIGMTNKAVRYVG